ncbi:aspartate aminotransferase-like [Lineus longissimus]|uniref:aspartate aminotransferase-like n=1 Tax=Lineus longissimus TaxID=88925 RepID=UPI002B4C6273
MTSTHEHPAKNGPVPLISPHLKEYGAAHNILFNEKIKNLIASGRKIYHLGFGQSPFPLYEGAVEALKEFAAEKSYLPTEGIPSLRKAICSFHKKYDDFDFDPSQVVVGPGSKELIFLLVSVFNGDVLLLAPTWPTYKPQVQLGHKRDIIIDTGAENGWKITPRLIEKAVKENDLHPNRMLILCNPDNPTGVSYTKEDFEALAVAFRKHNILVLSDEIYARLHHTQDHVSMATFYPEGTILSTGMSKWASAGGWRMGYHIFPQELDVIKNAVKSAGSHTYSCCPAPMQYAIAKMLSEEKGVEDFIRHTAKIMAVAANFVHRELTSVGVKVVKPGGAYYMFPDFEVIRPALNKRGLTTGEEMTAAMLEEASVALMAGGPAFIRPLEELTVRLCFVNFDGAEALRVSRNLGLEKELNDEFLKLYCTQLYDGIKALSSWVLAQLRTV